MDRAYTLPKKTGLALTVQTNHPARDCFYTSSSSPLWKKVACFVRYRRQLYATAWDNKTAHHAYRPVPPGLPSSYGQCVPTSCFLFKELQKQFPKEMFVLRSGRVLMSTKDKIALDSIITAHVWLTWQRPHFSDISVIDVTADQSSVLPPTLIATHTQLATRGIVYHEHRTFFNPTELIAEFSKREPNLQERLDYFEARIAAL